MKYLFFIFLFSIVPIRVGICIEKGQKYFNNRPKMFPLDEKQIATIICINLKLAFVPNKTFMDMKENKYGNKTYLANEIITKVEIYKIKAI